MYDGFLSKQIWIPVGVDSIERRANDLPRKLEDSCKGLSRQRLLLVLHQQKMRSREEEELTILSNAFQRLPELFRPTRILEHVRQATITIRSRWVRRRGRGGCGGDGSRSFRTSSPGVDDGKGTSVGCEVVIHF
jgi:hypothetical protein